MAIGQGRIPPRCEEKSNAQGTAIALGFGIEEAVEKGFDRSVTERWFVGFSFVFNKSVLPPGGVGK